MGDLDISLIREFQSRPAFYDRNDPYFKDKFYIEHAWEQIANTLGYDVPLLKDRMLQLRNRYNLEKRRLENLAIENPHKACHSPWPLYPFLTFLSNHIRSRRSYKTMMTRSNLDICYSNSNSNNGSPSNGQANDHSYSIENNSQSAIETTVHVKQENEEMEFKETENRQEEEYNDPTNYMLRTENNEASPTKLPATNGVNDPRRVSLMPQIQAHQPSLSVRSADSLKRHFPQPPHFHQNHYPFPVKRQRFEGRMEKFDAFGKFISTSMCDLPENKALELVQKFTNELVKAFMYPNQGTFEPNNLNITNNSETNGSSNLDVAPIQIEKQSAKTIEQSPPSPPPPQQQPIKIKIQNPTSTNNAANNTNGHVDQMAIDESSEDEEEEEEEEEDDDDEDDVQEVV